MRTDISSVGTGGRVQSAAVEAVPRLELPASWAAGERPGLQTQESHVPPRSTGAPRTQPHAHAIPEFSSAPVRHLVLVFYKNNFCSEEYIGPFRERSSESRSAAFRHIPCSGDVRRCIAGLSRCLLLQNRACTRADCSAAASAPAAPTYCPISPSLQVQNLATVNKAETSHCSPIS